MGTFFSNGKCINRISKVNMTNSFYENILEHYLSELKKLKGDIKILMDNHSVNKAWIAFCL